MSRIPLAGFVAVLVLSGCEALQSPTEAPLLKSGATVVGHANGDGVFDIGAPGADIALDLNALLRADGRATGKVTYAGDLTAFGLGTIAMKFDVTCLALNAAQGRAWIGGVVTENTSTNATFATDPRRQVGRDVWFRIEDNGHGGSGILDRTTQLGFEGAAGINTSEEYCELQIWPAAPPHTVNTGNLSVR